MYNDMFTYVFSLSLEVLCMKPPSDTNIFPLDEWLIVICRQKRLLCHAILLSGPSSILNVLGTMKHQKSHALFRYA